MRRRGARAGYTLTEMLLVVAIVGIVASVGAVLFRELEDFYLTTTARNETQRDARQALDLIDRELRQAVSSTITVDSPSGQGYFSRISFSTVDGHTIKFYQNGTQLIELNGTTQSVLSQDLYYLAFCFPDTQDPSIINVSITISKNIQLGQKKALQMSIQKVRIMN